MYATADDMITRYGEREIVRLTDRAIPPAGVIDTAVLDQALADAAGVIDGYLAARYPLPLATVPVVLVRACCDIARLLLHEQAAPEAVTELHRSQIKFLEMVAKGTISLGPDGAQNPVATAGGPDFSTPGRTFNADTLADF